MIAFRLSVSANIAMLAGAEKGENDKGGKSSNFSSFTESISVRNLVGKSQAEIQIKPSQAILNEGSEDELLITGFKFNLTKSLVTGTLFVMTAGLLWLFLYWMPKIRLRFTHDIVDLDIADTILIEVSYFGTRNV